MQPQITELKPKMGGKYTRGQKAHNASDLTKLVVVGQMFGDWCVINSSAKLDKGYRYIEVTCSTCGLTRWQHYDNLKAGKSRACMKCAKSKITKYNTKLEQALNKRGQAAKSRCNNSKDPSYHRYGARGITFDFTSIEEYVNYVKQLPNASVDLEVDRIDNNKGYTKGNLRFVSRDTQVRNTRRNRNINYDGTTICLADFTRNYTDLSLSTTKRLLDQGFTPEELRRIIICRKGGRPSLRSVRCKQKEPLRGSYDRPIYLHST